VDNPLRLARHAGARRRAEADVRFGAVQGNNGRKKNELKMETMKRTKEFLIGMGFVTVVVLTLSFGNPVLAAASDKDVNVVNTPANPVPVTGTVGVSNDSLFQPYIKTGSFNITAGNNLGEVDFDVPDHKRLILESVAIQADVPEGQKVRISLDSQVNPAINKYAIGFLTVQSPGPIGGYEYYVANQPFKLRQDWFNGSNAEIVVRMLRDSTTSDAGLLVTVYGYLVDSPSSGGGF
jgi:hypothetical protein